MRSDERPHRARGGGASLGRDLVRCEGVMVARDGSIWAAHGRGAGARIAPDDAREERIGRSFTKL